MSDRRPLLFNPQRASTQELESTLVRDWPLLEQLEKDLQEDHRRGTPRHWQIIGPRGSGKSHLTELLARRMKDRYGWSAVRLPEEHYQVATVSELLEQILVRLTGAPSPYARLTDHQAVEDSILSHLRQRRRRDSAPILVIIENLGLLLERQLRSQRDQARLRQILTDDPAFIVVATATSYVTATTSHSAPFYDFFHSLVLADLSRTEVAELVEARARWDGQEELLRSFNRVRNQLAAIYHLSGGNPRLVVALYNVLRDGVTEELHTQLLQLLDEVTPYFQARIGDVPPQAARILTEMAIAPGPVLPAVLARRCRMPTNQVTAQLRKLQEQRLVVPGGRPNLRSRYYEVKDRLFRIWLQMREDQSTRGRLRFLTEFFQRWYGHRSDELRQAAQKLADAFWHELDRGDPLRCSEHLRTLDYLRQASKERPNIVLDSLVAAVNNREDDPATLRAKLIPLEAMYRDAESEDGREDVGYVIATVENMLGDREQSLAVLSELVERGSTNGRIVSALLDRLIEDERCEEAWNKGSQVLSSHPELSRVREARAVAGIALGRIDDGLAEATRLIEETSCPNCRQRIAMRTTRELARLRQFDRALPLFRSAIGKEQADANPESMRALVDIAGGTGVTTNNFALAARFWGHLSDAPFWFLQAAICALSHRDGAASQALDFMSAAAEKVGGVLPQFAVDHLIDILAKLKASTEGDSAGRVSLERAVAFVEQHTDPRLLAVAFRNTVPGLARTRPDLRVHLLGLYSQLRDRGLLSEDISPYVEASTVILSPDREGALMGLHPEIREAVKLLLPEDEESPASAGERGSSKRRAGAQGTSRQ